MNKKVSIIVPVYNVESYLEKCLNTLVNQTLKEIEIIIVNDGSTDNSEEIIKKYENKYKKIIKSYKKENGGLSSARNEGLKHATGDFVAFVDSDDYVDLSMYENLYTTAIKKKSDIVVSATELVYPDHKRIVPASFNLANDYRNYLLSAPMACNKIFKRDLFKDPFLFKEGIWYEDLELIPTLLLKTKQISFQEVPYYKYLQRTGSIMNQEKSNPKVLDIYTVLESIEKRFKEFKQYEEYQEEIEYLYIEHLLYSSALRVSSFKDGKKYLHTFKKTIEEKFPDWKKNIYFKKKSLPFKIICSLCFHEKRFLIYLLNKRR